MSETHQELSSTMCCVTRGALWHNTSARVLECPAPLVAAYVRGIVGLVAGATFSKVPDVSLLTSVKTKGGQFAGDWGKLTAAFTGFTQLSTVVRGRYDSAQTTLPRDMNRWVFPLS